MMEDQRESAQIGREHQLKLVEMEIGAYLTAPECFPLYREAIEGTRVCTDGSMDQGIFCLEIWRLVIEWVLVDQLQGAELGKP